MRRVILSMHMTLDGFIEGPHGDLSWMQFDDDSWADEREVRDTADTVILGRVAFEGFSDYWRRVLYDPEAPPQEKNFAHWVDHAAKIVFSQTLTESDWNYTRIINGDLSAEIAQLKRQSGKNLILIGGARIADACVTRDLVDDYRLYVHPVTLGAGKRLFTDMREHRALRRRAAKTFANGSVGLFYSRS